jgi:hypothetical protein
MINFKEFKDSAWRRRESSIEIPAGVATDEEFLYWRPASWKIRSRPTVMPGRTTLHDFIGIARVAEGDRAAAIEAFAREWGALEICAHDKPRYHSQSNGLARVACPPRAVPSRSRFAADYEFMEPLAIWTRTARQVESLLKSAKLLQEGAPLERRTLRECWPGVTGLTEPFSDNWSGDWAYVIGVLGTLMTEAKIGWRPVAPRQEGHHPALMFTREAGLFSALIWELSATLGRSSVFATCSECGRLFSPKRKPRKDRRIYCTACRQRKVPYRNAQRDYRTRKKEQSKIDDE